MNKFKPKIIFVGTPDMGLICLNSLLENNFNIVAVVPPLKSHSTHESFKKYALSKNLNLVEFEKTPNEKEYIEKIKSYNADIGVVCSYNVLLSKEFLTTTKFGYINCHPSLLPCYRGAMPYFHIIKNGEKKSGITLHFMDEKFDTGNIILQEEFEILPFETMGVLFNRTNYMLSEALVKTLKAFEKDGVLNSFPQKEGCYIDAPKVDGDFKIRWNKKVEEIDCLIRACNPFFNAFCYFRKTYFKIIKAHIIKKEHNLEYGTIAFCDENNIYIAAKGGFIAIDIISVGSWGCFSVKDFYYIFSPKIGEKLE